ncbi:nucleolar protein [Elasticomyces elasticus]|nr:nucleolar protein [Elasticomyces elasticus]KAK3639689.1 nucleolar protein [Elasticomyces elasticus]KAK4922551.1 nucleolar protein [Elasticomyces elasticus]KAK5760724.1 nucleolar protein [Elasticomyces elasticus]
MSTETANKKRKSSGDAVSATKKVKTDKSASKPAPLKSALKKTVPKDEVAVKKTKTSKTSEKRPAKDIPVAEKPTKAKAAKETAMKEKPAKEIAVKEKPVKAKKDVVKEEVTQPEKSTKKKGAKAVSKAVEAVAEDNEDDDLGLEDTIDSGAALTEDQTAALIAGFSSSEDEAEEEEDGVAIAKLPQVPSMADVQKRIKDATAADPERSPGVVYVGRVPHGFYEPQMRAYFSQFGTIKNMRLARNRKTGKSQHYAFIEFSSKAVAEIVAKTMDKYLLFGHIMQVRIVPQEQVKENMWKGTGRRKKPAPRNRLEGSALKRGKVREDWEKKIEAEEKKRAAKAEQLKEMGYEFEMPAVKAVGDVPVKPKTMKTIEDANVPEAEGDKKLSAAEVLKEVLAGERPVESVPAAEAETIVEEVKKVSKKRSSMDGKTTMKKAKKVKT